MTITALTDLDFYATLIEQPAPSLVVVTAPHCGACHALKQALVPLLPQYAIFELDAVHNGGMVQELEVFHLPALFLYVNGEYHAELKTPPKTSAIKQSIEQALTQPAEEAP